MYYRPALPVPSEALTVRNAQFARAAWGAGLRPDQRDALQMREASIEFLTLSRDRVQVRLGDTVVACSVQCELVEPMPFKPKHGFLGIHVRQLLHERCARERPEELKQLGAFLDRIFKERVMDLEGLCVIPRLRVWSVRLDVLVLSDDGNVTDAAAWAVAVVLQHTRRPQLTIRGEDIIVHPAHEADPVPLTLHYTPVCCTFAVTADPYAGTTAEAAAAAAASASAGLDPALALTLVVDPTADECAAAACLVTVGVTEEGQVCVLQKQEGCDLPWALLQDCTAHAAALAPSVLAMMTEAMAAHDKQRADAFSAQFQWARQRLGVGKSETKAAEKAEEPAAKARRTESPS